jgi:hypothetical protein
VGAEDGIETSGVTGLAECLLLILSVRFTLLNSDIAQTKPALRHVLKGLEVVVGSSENGRKGSDYQYLKFEYLKFCGLDIQP